MEKGFLHLHLTVIIIFLLSFSFKSVLLLIGNEQLLEKVRSKTKILEMILGTLILVTGIYLLVVTKNSSTYMIVKIVLVLIAIPLGIVGMKKNNKLLAIISLILFIYIFAVAQTKDLGLNIGRKPVENTSTNIDGEIPKQNPVKASENILENNKTTGLENGKVLYNKLCIQCHGPEGNLGAGGAKNLITSALTDDAKKNVIANGKGLMAPFKYTISEQDIKQVVLYINTFKK